MLNLHVKLPHGATNNKVFNIFVPVRTIAGQKKHNEPEELAWQWQVKKDPALYHGSMTCVSRVCPKKSFFPRFRSVYIPEEKFSCKKKKEKTMTWCEYFNFLLPDSMTAPKPPLRTCRKLLALRQDICLDPKDWACCEVECLTQPKEWYGQGVVHAILSDLPEHKILPIIKPCSPPDHMIPRCVIAKKGIDPSKTLSTTCFLSDTYKEPYSDFRGSSITPIKTRKYICRFKCYDEQPQVLEKSLKLACRWYAEYKNVDCPKQMFTRFKNVKILPCGDIKPVSAKEKEEICTRVEVKKGVCGRTTLLRPPSVRNFSTSSFLSGSKIKDILAKSRMVVNPCKSSIVLENLVKRSGMPPLTPEYPKNDHGVKATQMPPRFQTEEDFMQPKEKSFEVETKGDLFPQNTTSKEKKKRNFRGASRSFSTSAINLKQTENTKGGNKKKDEEKVAPICSGCAGIREAMKPKKAKSVFNCSKRPGGKCKGPLEPGPHDPPVVSPYWKCKTQALSKCNQPREVICEKERTLKMPCEPESKKKFHSASAQKKSVRSESCINPEIEGKCGKSGFICKIASLFGIGGGKKNL